jgi:hypothetical protein
METLILLLIFIIVISTFAFGINSYLGIKTVNVTFKSKKNSDLYFFGHHTLSTHYRTNSIEYWTFQTEDCVDITDPKFIELLYKATTTTDTDMILVDDTNYEYTIESITKPEPHICECNDEPDCCSESTCCGKHC